MNALPFLTADWHHLLMLNYRIDPAVLRPLVPSGTTLDSYKGETMISLVGFRFIKTRLLGLPIPFHCNFDEVNLRFYVRRDCLGEVRRGVVFVKEIVPRAAIAWVARTFYNENYVAMPMRHCIEPPTADPASGLVRYEWRHRGHWNHLAARIGGEPAPAEDGSEEQFVTEHYWGYAAQPDGDTLEYQVEHPSWRVWRATDASLECDVRAIYGSKFCEALAAPPTSTFVADGSAVTVRRGQRFSDGA